MSFFLDLFSGFITNNIPSFQILYLCNEKKSLFGLQINYFVILFPCEIGSKNNFSQLYTSKRNYVLKQLLKHYHLLERAMQGIQISNSITMLDKKKATNIIAVFRLYSSTTDKAYFKWYLHNCNEYYSMMRHIQLLAFVLYVVTLSLIIYSLDVSIRYKLIKFRVARDY